MWLRGNDIRLFHEIGRLLRELARGSSHRVRNSEEDDLDNLCSNDLVRRNISICSQSCRFVAKETILREREVKLVKTTGRRYSHHQS